MTEVPVSATFQACDDAIAFRDALGRFATGVTLVTTATPQGPVGMIANSFASVSLDPPLVLWSPARSSSRFSLFETARHFVIHVLSQDQTDISMAFGRGGPGFDDVEHSLGDHGAPLIDRALARFECDTHATHDGGDHLIMVGRVGRVTTADGAPMVFHGGRFARLTE
ncbi:flavin reductase family protein [Falsirhodobacter halotolerans]|uniref:flavin reductase family protein n=1 Tax=Falsirhodobacter halotolerans TaxID=1146892 RepID=UPI001FD4237C|nr:flavin reductase family protein [Falsirhodobacter halotolerans]MCJ8138948.1 flavin reductase family protein [Falsirhodobacter halotolerans]